MVWIASAREMFSCCTLGHDLVRNIDHRWTVGLNYLGGLFQLWWFLRFYTRLLWHIYTSYAFTTEKDYYLNIYDVLYVYKEEHIYKCHNVPPVDPQVNCYVLHRHYFVWWDCGIHHSTQMPYNCSDKHLVRIGAVQINWFKIEIIIGYARCIPWKLTPVANTHGIKHKQKRTY